MSLDAEPRRRAYGLLAELVSRGPTPATRAAAEASPLIEAALEGYPTLDEAAADHQHVFGFAVPPFEGAFVDPEGRAGASAAEHLRETYGALGFAPDPTGDDPEHLASELGALAWLSAAEVAAAGRGDDDGIARARDGARRLLDEHLLRWVPVLAAAVRRSARPFPTALVAQVDELLRAHRKSLPRAPDDEAAFALPPAPDLLADPSTGLGEVAERLALAALSGLFVSRDDITRIGRAVGVPRGFGDRRVMLLNLLRGAVHADSFGALLEALLALVDGADAELRALEDEDGRRLAPVVVPWRERLAGTRALLERMHDAVPLDPEDSGVGRAGT